MGQRGYVFNSKPQNITDLRQLFLSPANATHRQYEALRAFFVEGLPSKEAARRFGYSAGSFRILTHQRRQNPEPFLSSPSQGTPGRSQIRPLAPKDHPGS